MKRISTSFRRMLLLAVSAACLATSFFSSAEIAESGSKTTVSMETAENLKYGYSEYMDEHADAQPGSSSVTLTAQNVISTGADKDQNSSLLFEDDDKAEWVFDCPADGYYNIAVIYGALMKGSRTNYSAVLTIDGKTPFYEAGDMKLPKLYQNETDKTEYDDFGNELTPYQSEVNVEQKQYFRDYSGYFDDPYRFYFAKGTHEIKIVFTSGGISVKAIQLIVEDNPPAYAEALAQWKAQGYAEAHDINKPLVLQGEDAVLKSDTVLYPRYDNTSANTYPSSPSKTVLNTIGGQNWSYSGQSILWKINVPQSGLYRIALRVRQNYKRGVQVSRKISINGAVPFREFENYRFDFSNKWYIDTLGNGENDYSVYLKQGENTVELTAVASYSELVRRLNEMVFDLNAFYRSVIMITGTDPDTYQDYDLQNNMTGFKQTISVLTEQLKKFITLMEQQGFRKGGEAEVINRLIAQLDSFREDPTTVPFRMSSFQSNISSMASWIQTLSEQPLEIDCMYFLAKNQKAPRANSGLVETAGFIFRRLLSSFANDYSSLGTKEQGTGAIDVWLNMGRDQAQVIKRLTDDLFMSGTPYKVNVSLVQQSLIPATLAGTGPDVAIFISPNDIINLAARNALADLSQYAGLESLKSRFHTASLIPYAYMDGTYGLPVAESFFVTFYRKDVFAELGLEPPDTWDDFYNVLKVLQRNNLQAGIPTDQNVLGQAVTQGQMFFANLLYQHGGTYYKDGWKTTGFDTEEALNALIQWTEFYTKYSLPTDFDFYSRFRTGEMPVGIAEYTFQNQLSVAAPEINGLWSIAPIPGRKDENGNVNRSVVGNTSGIILFKKAENKKAGFEYLKWFTSEDVQKQYSKEIEALMGPAARHPSANTEAMESLPWDGEIKQVLLDQWDELQMVQQTPVNYYVSRNLTNIFRNIVYYNKNPREVLSSYNRDINREIIRRREEFGLNG